MGSEWQEKSSYGVKSDAWQNAALEILRAWTEHDDGPLGAWAHVRHVAVQMSGTSAMAGHMTVLVGASAVALVESMTVSTPVRRRPVGIMCAMGS